MEILKVLKAARWVSTSQLRKRFWTHATADAARKRLRILANAGLIRRYQEHQMKEMLFTLGPEGKNELERLGDLEIALESKPPKHRHHFLAVNDIRIAAELMDGLDFFFGYWELPGIGWQYSLIPDAIFSIQDHKFAVEVDRGKETTKYFVKSKMGVYRSGLHGFALRRLLIVTDRRARILSLADRVGPSHFIRYALLEDVRRFGIESPIFLQLADKEGSKTLLSNSLDDKRSFKRISIGDAKLE